MEFLEVPIFDDDVFKLLVRFGINLFFLTLIVVYALYPSQRERDFAFTAVMLNIIVFFICFTMKKLELDLGLALGLFAVFGVLRYRTDAIRVKEMTYLFIVIGIAVINSLSNKSTSYTEVLLVNSLIFVAAILKEWMVGWIPEKPSKTNGVKKGKNKAGQKQGKERKVPRYTIQYDRLEWLGDAHRESLLNDLRSRTGMVVTKVEIKSIDLVQNKATLVIWTNSEPQSN
ncbi:MAG: DUF4956 domain-containing protein [Planctomycetaceae bacterium]|nr:DUF4956 domain-containing protein [Planctomycetaceae bacterium]